MISKFNLPAPSRRVLWLLAAVVLCATAFLFKDLWLPRAQRAWNMAAGRSLDASQAEPGPMGAGHSAAGHDDHDHADHEETDSIELSEQAQKNIGLKLADVTLQSFERSISVPGIAVGRPGQSRIEVTAPLTGVVTQIHAIQGEAVQPGAPLFELRVTHEELVQAQTEFLLTSQELDVIEREVYRLERATSGGAIAGKALLAQKYEQQKQEAALRAQWQSLVLHGLSDEQVSRIRSTGTLLQSLTVRAPEATSEPRTGPAGLLQLDRLQVEQGQHVETGAKLCSLVDPSQLYLEGKAFEQDAAEVNQAAANDWPVSAVLESRGAKPEIIQGLDIFYVSGEIDLESRALHFYVSLPNRLLREAKTSDGRTFVYWRFKTGQRMQIRVPVEKWEDRIVLPNDAVVTDGAETYVFLPNGDHFDRRPVHVEYRDQYFSVIANDGSVFPGDMVVQSGGHQLQLALKNKAGGGVDPHAGHSH